MGKLTDRGQATGVTLNNSIIHVVNTDDTTQSPSGSSYKSDLGQILLLSPRVTGGTYNTLTESIDFSGTPLFTPFSVGVFSPGTNNPSAINIIATDGTATESSGALTPLISSQVLIPANTLSTNCILEIIWSVFRVSGAAGTIQSTIYISTTSGTLGSAPSVGSTLISTGPNLTSTNFSVQGRRDLNKQGVDGKTMNASAAFNADGTPSGAITTFTIDNSNDVYLQFCTGSTGFGDRSNIRGVRVTQYKQL